MWHAIEGRIVSLTMFLQNHSRARRIVLSQMTQNTCTHVRSLSENPFLVSKDEKEQERDLTTRPRSV